MFPDLALPALMGVLLGASGWPLHREGGGGGQTTGRAHVLWSFLKASFWTLGLLSVAALTGLDADLSARPLMLTGLAGGILFGVGAGLNGACSFSTLARLAEGHGVMLMTLLRLGARASRHVGPLDESAGEYLRNVAALVDRSARPGLDPVGRLASHPACLAERQGDFIGCCLASVTRRVSRGSCQHRASFDGSTLVLHRDGNLRLRRRRGGSMRASGHVVGRLDRGDAGHGDIRGAARQLPHSPGPVVVGPQAAWRGQPHGGGRRDDPRRQ